MSTLHELTTDQTRISVETYTPRWDDEPVNLTEALDFWSAAASAANVVMQMSMPGVGHGVVESRVESGALMEHPWKRLRTTAQYMAVAVLGTDQERAAYRDAINVAHRQVRSTDESPVKYNAFDRDLQLWVAACLFVFYEDTYQLLRGKMTEEQAEEFYHHAWPLGTTLQVTADQWPATRAEFDTYWNTTCRTLEMDEAVREFLLRLIGLKMVNPIIRVLFAPLLRFLTIGFLSPVFRELLGVEWSATEQRQFENLFLFVSFVNRFIPRFIRTANYAVLMGDLRYRLRRNKSLI
ncbi:MULTISPECIES: oxygenase MpaB family protein [Mycolicibacter]|uniref:Oxygenase MpaB family protein n=1 Tax=[Mycobacterium] vasticus TaxID=2875777 RepID=A0ABU5Z0D5_9MYCO|nr:MULTISPECIES: oxygenase MpaB family protein [unclassified Mycolicibacter]MEB3062140.1 oxygenase MpaB family protein [Mycolicibacter sp. MYC101]MEB3070365.1 oxygenase MpaB family protein [Mycolicibacter sp. MYC017]